MNTSKNIPSKTPAARPILGVPPKGDKKPVTPNKAPAQRKPALSKGSHVSFKTCVKTLSNVSISRKGLLQLELAVGLAVFLDSGVANKSAKNMLQEIYHGAGYDCLDSKGKSYKTVNRRIQASAGLFGKIGLEVLNHWVDDTHENKMIQVLAQKVNELGFSVLDDVHEYVGRVSNRTETKKEASPFDIVVGEKTVHIPKTLSEAELIELANKLLALAEEVHILEAQKAQEPPAPSEPIKTPPPSGLPERRAGEWVGLPDEVAQDRRAH